MEVEIGGLGMGLMIPSPIVYYLIGEPYFLSILSLGLSLIIIDLLVEYGKHIKKYEY